MQQIYFQTMLADIDKKTVFTKPFNIFEQEIKSERKAERDQETDEKDIVQEKIQIPENNTKNNWYDDKSREQDPKDPPGFSVLEKLFKIVHADSEEEKESVAEEPFYVENKSGGNQAAEDRQAERYSEHQILIDLWRA